MAKERVYLWDNLKFFSIICILVLHSTIPYAMDGMLLIKYMQPFINLYPMTLFAIISGFWFKERATKKLAILFLWPCLLFTVINGLLGATSPHFPNYLEKFMFKAGYAMWYLLALFLFSIVTKYLLKAISSTECLVVAFAIAFIIGFLPIPNRFFDIQRISCLFPSFAYGVWFRDKICKRNSMPEVSKELKWGGVNFTIRMCCVFVLCFCILFNLACIHFFPAIANYGGFVNYYGLNFKAGCSKWGMFAIRAIACTCLVFVVSNKKYWFTKYGSRTMNVYLLHMIIIFPLSWGVLYNYRYEKFGLLFYFVLIPLFCTVFFSTSVDKFIKKILLIKHLK